MRLLQKKKKRAFQYVSSQSIAQNLLQNVLERLLGNIFQLLREFQEVTF